jgi:uncharacterized membrane protein
MALVGMSLVLVRALKNGHGFEATVMSALGWMAALGIVGWITAAIAQTTVDESVRQIMEQELLAASQASTV